MNNGLDQLSEKRRSSYEDLDLLNDMADVQPLYQKSYSAQNTYAYQISSNHIQEDTALDAEDNNLFDNSLLDKKQIVGNDSAISPDPDSDQQNLDEKASQPADSNEEEFQSCRNIRESDLDRSNSSDQSPPKEEVLPLTKKNMNLDHIDLVQSHIYSPEKQTHVIYRDFKEQVEPSNRLTSELNNAFQIQNPLGMARPYQIETHSRDFCIGTEDLGSYQDEEEPVETPVETPIEEVVEEPEEEVKERSEKSERMEAEIETRNTKTSSKGSRTSSIDESSMSKNLRFTDNFADGDTQYPMVRDSLRISKTIETQTNDYENPSGYVTGLSSDELEIMIPETKMIKDGLLYSYLVYKIVTQLKVNNKIQTEFIVYRRYSDFAWLFENLANKYLGYIIPVPPPKNILTALNKEGVEFAETRKKELGSFLRKCMQHHFLRNTPELNLFLSDDKGFADYKKKEQALQGARKDSSILANVSKIINNATKQGSYHLRELSDTESEIYNREVLFLNLKRRLQLFSASTLEYLQLRKKQTAALLSFTHDLEVMLVDSRASKLDESFKKITRTQISKQDDDLIKDLTEKVDIQLKNIIINIEAVVAALERRNNMITQLGHLNERIEETSLKVKKESSNGDELEEMKKDYERLRRKAQEASEILLTELNISKIKVNLELNEFIKALSKRKELYFLNVCNLWAQTFHSEYD